MSTFPGAPKILKAGIILADPATGDLRRVITLQYNPENLSRSFEIQRAAENIRGIGALRLTGPPLESITLEAAIDATDQLEVPDQHPSIVSSGIQPHLAALETIVYPASNVLESNNALAATGTLEIAPMQSALVLFVWNKRRVMPVRISSLSITEEAFDPKLNPTRARVSLTLQVLTIDDLGFGQKGGNLFMVYQKTKESLVQQYQPGSLDVSL